MAVVGGAARRLRRCGGEVLVDDVRQQHEAFAYETRHAALDGAEQGAQAVGLVKVPLRLRARAQQARDGEERLGARRLRRTVVDEPQQPRQRVELEQ
eukprot:3243830-Prymnesium_polylepis.1